MKALVFVVLLAGCTELTLDVELTRAQDIVTLQQMCSSSGGLSTSRVVQRHKNKKVISIYLVGNCANGNQVTRLEVP